MTGVSTLRLFDDHPPPGPRRGPAQREEVSSPSDAEVINRSLTQPDQFSLVFDRHAPALHRYCRRRVGPATAEDIVGETFLIAFERRDRYDRAQPHALPWLYGIATNLLRRHQRSEVRAYRALARTGVDPVCEGQAERVAERVDAGAYAERMAAALAKMHRRDRDVLLLFAWAELSYAEIAAALDIPVGTVRSRLNRAREKVRSALSDATEPTRAIKDALDPRKDAR
jgi:RNA polymerase sigma-70 factor (ECF subfamily)